MWQLYGTAKAQSCRPSELLLIEDPVDAFRLDRAVNHFGSTLKSELDSIQKKNEQQTKNARMRVLKKWIPEASSRDEERFADPARQG